MLSVSVDGVETASYSENEGWGTADFGLFSTNWTGGGAECSIGKCKLYNGTTLIRDLVPVQRIQDSVLGYYDLLSDTFYSTTSSAFTPGPEYIVMPNKIIYNGEVLIDITDTTAVASDVAAGKIFYTADGRRRIGTA